MNVIQWTGADFVPGHLLVNIYSFFFLIFFGYFWCVEIPISTAQADPYIWSFLLAGSFNGGVFEQFDENPVSPQWEAELHLNRIIIRPSCHAIPVDWEYRVVQTRKISGLESILYHQEYCIFVHCKSNQKRTVHWTLNKLWTWNFLQTRDVKKLYDLLYFYSWILYWFHNSYCLSFWVLQKGCAI